MDTPKPIRVLVADADSDFAGQLKMAAKASGLSAIICLSLDNPDVLKKYAFAAAIIDCDLVRPESADQVATSLGNVPIILITHEQGLAPSDASAWPACICALVKKEQGVDAVLKTTQKILSSKKAA